MAETIRYLVDRGIPVMAHIGLTPQSVNVLGGFKTQGRTIDQWHAIEEDARLVAEAGAFAVVLEAMTAPLAERITKAIPIPTIGIGASPGCDGQILVMEDMLGLSPNVPKFVKKFGAIGASIDRAIGALRRGSPCPNISGARAYLYALRTRRSRRGCLPSGPRKSRRLRALSRSGPGFGPHNTKETSGRACSRRSLRYLCPSARVGRRESARSEFRRAEEV